MMRKLFAILLLFPFALQAQQQFQLAPPVVQYPSVYYDSSVTVRMAFRHPGAVIRYTLDGRAVDAKSPVYTKPLVVKNGVRQLTVRSFAKGFQPSEPVQLQFMPKGIPVTAVKGTAPEDKYKAGGLPSLIDLKGGHSATTPDWLGYLADTVVIEAELAGEQRVKEAMLEFLVNEGSWIFLPESLKLDYWDKAAGTYRTVAAKAYLHHITWATGTYPEFLKLAEPVLTSRIRLTLITVNKMPDWHAAKGEHAWLFIDELKLY